MKIFGRTSHGAKFGLALAMAAGSAQAQSDPRQKHLTLLEIPSGTVAPSGMVFGSLSYSTGRSGLSSTADGSFEFGMGLGNAEDSVGLQVSAVISTLSQSPRDSGYLVAKASRRITGGDKPTYLGLEVDHIGGWGDAEGVDPSAKIALTRFGLTRFGGSGEVYPYMLTLGAGTHMRYYGHRPGVFLGAGVGLTPNLGVSAAWTGETVDLGAGLRLSQKDNVTVSAALNDAFDTRDSRQITISFGWALAGLFGR